MLIFIKFLCEGSVNVKKTNLQVRFFACKIRKYCNFLKYLKDK